MKLPILSTKLYIPPLQPKTVFRSSLIEQLNRGAKTKLTLISASAGFGKTILLCQWVESYDYPVGWISLDEEHNDPMRFLLYVLGAMQSVTVNIGESIFGMVLSPQPPPYKTILTLLINEITNFEDDFTLILDDYHLIDSREVDDILIYLLENMPSQMHLIISTREDPRLPIARLRAQGQMIEIRVADLRFNQSETDEFMNQIMELNLKEENIYTLEIHTEGWITGLQLAAISMKDNNDISGFIKSFTGSNRYIIDYLAEEVLNKISTNLYEFLLRTSVLDRMCGPLCDEIFPNNDILGQETLEYLEKINMFVIPLDSERRWYRYHHLFSEILRQRMSISNIVVDKNKDTNIEDLHLLASNWYEKNNLYVEAFRHAAKANDIERAQRLIKGNRIPLQFLGASVPILNWLDSLDKDVLDAYPSLWVTYASTLCMTGKIDAVEDKLIAAESILKGRDRDDFVRNLMGHIASNRAFLALTQRKTQTVLSQSKIALEYLHPDNIAVRTSNKWIRGMAYHTQGNLEDARSTLQETIAICNSTGNFVVGISAASVLGLVYEEENELHLAATTYQNSLKSQGSITLPAAACFSHIGLARIFYEWNDIEASLKHCLKSIELSQQLVDTDISIICEVFLARIKVFYKDFNEATRILDKAIKTVKMNNFVERTSDLVSVQVIILIKKGNLSKACKIAKEYNIPICEARVNLAKNEGDKAIKLLETLLGDTKKAIRQDKRLEVLILLSLANHIVGYTEKSSRLLEKALSLSAPNDFIRRYIDEGEKVLEILKQTSVSGKVLQHKNKILEVFKSDNTDREEITSLSSPQLLIESLSKREYEVLLLIAQGFSNREISEKLFLAIDTVKGHNRRIYGKLGVNNRTSAVKKASNLGIITI